MADPIQDQLFGGQLSKRENEIKALPKWQTEDLNINNPLPWQTYLPKELVDKGQQISDRANSPDYFKDTVTRGVGQGSFTRGRVDESPSTFAADSLGSGYGGAMSKAIANKYSKDYGSKVGAIKAQTEADAPVMQSQEKSRAADIFGKAQAIAMNNFREQQAYQEKRAQMYNAWKNAQNQAEAGFWGALMGLGGVVAGTALGGPIGGAIGGGVAKTATTG